MHETLASSGGRGSGGMPAVDHAAGEEASNSGGGGNDGGREPVATGGTPAIGSGGETQGEVGPRGSVRFIAHFEPGSAWQSSDSARKMVRDVFDDFESLLRSSGEWDTVIDVYLTDNNPSTANTEFKQTFFETEFQGQQLFVVPAWLKIVKNEDVNAVSTGTEEGTEFTVHFNVNGHATNRGLLRHEIHHGLGAVNRVPNLQMTNGGHVLNQPSAGSTHRAALYDLLLVDRDGNRLLREGQDESGLFEFNDFSLYSSPQEWRDVGHGGISVRGVADDGGAFDMPVAAFVGTGNIFATAVLNEPMKLMFAGQHPTWMSISEPDRAFLRALHYQLAE